MKYTLTNIIGDAGEHLLVAKVIKLFGFPCRLTTIDIGIDAEIEIINNELKSTGEFLKCQVKTTLSDHYTIYIQKKHIEYWNSVNIPLVVFLVHLHTEKIYWHCIKDISQYEMSGSGVKIEFVKTNTLKKSSKKEFIELVHFKSFEEIRRIYEDAYAIAYKDKVELLDTDNYDFLTVEHFVHNLNRIQYSLSKVRKLQNRNKSLAKVDVEYAEQLNCIHWYLSEVKMLRDRVLNEEGSDYYDHLKSERNDWD